MRVIIFGCGGVGLTAKDKLEDEGMTVIAFADNNQKRQGTVIEGCLVIPPDEIVGYEYDYVAIAAFKHQSAIRKQLQSLEIPDTKIIMPIEPENKIFRNPQEYTEEGLVTLAKENYESEANKRFQGLHITVQDEVFLGKLEELKTILKNNNIPLEKVCVVKGSVMIAYGLRASKKFEDIDVIMTKDLREFYGRGNVFISEDIEMVAVGYLNGWDDDEIINNAERHFIFHGLKFMTLEDFYRYKRAIQIVKPKKIGLDKDLRVVSEFFMRHADIFTDILPEGLDLLTVPTQGIFVNPAKYTKEELLALPQDSLESASTRKYNETHLPVDDESLFLKLDKLKQLLKEFNIPREKVCVVRGAVMAAYGLRKLREAETIDIIMTEDLRTLYGRGYIRLSEDISMSAVYYMNGRDEDEIINNPDKHFVFEELKFMNLEEVYAFKKEVRLYKSYKQEVREDLLLVKNFYQRGGNENGKHREN